MPAKFDKEMLLKHRFWIMLGVGVALTLVGILILEFTEADRTLLAKALKDGKGTKVTDGPKSIEKYNEYAKFAKGNETTVWKLAYDPQAPLFTWPDQVEKQYDFANGYFANDVKVMKLADPNPKNAKDAAKNWPADNDFLMHGAFVEQFDDWFTIKNRNGDIIKFFQTDRTRKITGEDGKLQEFVKLRDVAGKKLLAVGYQRGKYFGDYITPKESTVFKEHYIGQIGPLLESIDPLDDKDNGVIQLRGWRYQKDKLPHEAKDGKDVRFVRYVSAEWPQGQGTPISKEAWIAQEDLWIQREIYRIIKSANDSVSSFAPQFEGKNDLKNKAYLFRNSYFDVELSLDKDENLFFKIINRQPRKQSIDLSFRVLLNNTKGHSKEIFKISGDALQPAGTKGKDFYSTTFRKGKDERTGIYSVEQVLSWQTAAIKRLDQISIGSSDAGDVAHSQRTFALGLKALDQGGAGGAPQKGAPKGQPAGMPDKMPKPAPGLKPGGKDAKNAGKGGRDQFGLVAERYVEVTEQARRLPVGVVLIVDQEHVDRVLTAFNNSKLRFLETQVLLNQYTGSLQPPVVEENANNTGGPAVPNMPNFPRLRPGGGGGIGPMPGFQPKNQSGESGSADLETNMEMVIYGIVTLYQRYPPRPVLPPLEK